MAFNNRMKIREIEKQEIKGEYICIITRGMSGKTVNLKLETLSKIVVRCDRMEKSQNQSFC